MVVYDGDSLDILNTNIPGGPYLSGDEEVPLVGVPDKKEDSSEAEKQDDQQEDDNKSGVYKV